MNLKKAQKTLKIFSIAALFIAFATYIAAVAIAGANIISMFLYILFFVLSLPLCGYYVLKKIIDIPDIINLILCSVSVGIFILLLSYIIFQPLGSSFIYILPNIIFGVLGAIDLIKNRQKHAIKLNENISILILTYSVFLILYVFIGVLSFARPSVVGAFFYHQDMFFSVGNAASVYNGFPFQDMRLANTNLNYHFLNDVTAGLLAYPLNISAYDALCFFYYPSFMALLCTAMYKTASLVCNNKLLCAFTPAILLFVNSSKSMLQYDYLLNMNGQGSSTFIALSFIILFYYVIKKNVISIPLSIVIFAHALVLSLFKSTIAGIILIALLCSSIVFCFLHKKIFFTLFYIIISFLAFTFAYITVFSNAINNLYYVGLEKISESISSAFSSSPLLLFLFAICGIIALINIKKQSFVSLVFYSAGLGGFLAFCLYDHYSFSQSYFYLIAIPFVIFSVLQPVLNFCKHKRMIGAALILLCLVSSVFAFDSIAIYASNGIRSAMNIFSIVQDPYDESYITAYDEQAMHWLRENTKQDTIFATNRNNRFYSSGDGIFHYYTAASQRRAYIEGFRYTLDYSAMYTEVRRRLEQVSDAIFYTLSEQDAFSLAQSEGIDYLVVKKTIGNPQTWEKDPVYENEEIAIYYVN